MMISTEQPRYSRLTWPSIRPKSSFSCGVFSRAVVPSAVQCCGMQLTSIQTCSKPAPSAERRNSHSRCICPPCESGSSGFSHLCEMARYLEVERVPREQSGHEQRVSVDGHLLEVPRAKRLRAEEAEGTGLVCELPARELRCHALRLLDQVGADAALPRKGDGEAEPRHVYAGAMVSLGEVERGVQLLLRRSLDRRRHVARCRQLCGQLLHLCRQSFAAVGQRSLRVCEAALQLRHALR
eukprot:scaffold121567_cov69-Phaeocystis_antarctica.AAC.3